MIQINTGTDCQGRVQHAICALIGVATCTLGVFMVWQIGMLKALLAA